jgi:hypothetical protein
LPLQQGSTPSERNTTAISVKDIFGIGANWVMARALAAKGKLNGAPIIFEHCQSLDNAGLLFMLPALLANGLLSYRDHYQEIDKVYYNLDFTVLLLCFMFLARIKNPEQLKHISSIEFGRLLGIDKIPETKRVRVRLNDISDQKKSSQWMKYLFHWWLDTQNEHGFLFYIDGHVLVYHGKNARLGKKHVSRQKLCLPGTCQYWVNDSQGSPYMFVNALVNEKLLEMLSLEIVPQIYEQVSNHISKETLEADPDLPLFTIIFDREGYYPKYFQELWQKRIAVITYRKNVTDKWDEDAFEDHEVEVEGDKIEMKLCEKQIELDGVPMREIRKLNNDGHQSSVITTNKKLSIASIAIYMFARWCQENYFRYMRQEYDLDRIYEYAVEQLDENIMVVNPNHSKLTQQLKKTREKINRKKAQLYQLETENIQADLDHTSKYESRQLKIISELNEFEIKENELIQKRKEHKYKIPLKEMPPDKRYNQLKQERNQFVNIIKMICYRAETTMTTLLKTYKKTKNERRAFIKSMIKRKGDIIPDYQNNTLTVNLYSMSTARENQAVEEICHLLNNSETLFPGTELRLIFKITTN